MAGQWDIFQLEDNLLKFAPFSIIPLKKLKNQSKDGIWELRVLSTCSMNSQSILCFSGINSLKNGKSGKI